MSKQGIRRLELTRINSAISAAAGFVAFLSSILGLTQQLGGGIFALFASAVFGLMVTLVFLGGLSRLRQVSSIPVAESAPKLACGKGPYEIREPTKIELGVKEGDLVKGYLKELGGQPFDWYLSDETNMVRFFNGDYDAFKPFRKGEGGPAYNFRSWRVKGEGPWYLIFDMYMKQIARRVEVYLRRSSPAHI